MIRRNPSTSPRILRTPCQIQRLVCLQCTCEHIASRSVSQDSTSTVNPLTKQPVQNLRTYLLILTAFTSQENLQSKSLSTWTVQVYSQSYHSVRVRGHVAHERYQCRAHFFSLLSFFGCILQHMTSEYIPCARANCISAPRGAEMRFGPLLFAEIAPRGTPP